MEDRLLVSKLSCPHKRNWCLSVGNGTIVRAKGAVVHLLVAVTGVIVHPLLWPQRGPFTSLSAVKELGSCPHSWGRFFFIQTNRIDVYLVCSHGSTCTSCPY